MTRPFDADDSWHFANGTHLRLWDVMGAISGPDGTTFRVRLRTPRPYRWCLPWAVLGEPGHAGVQGWLRRLDELYAQLPALHETSSAGQRRAG